MPAPQASVCVFFGSRFGAKPAYEAEARAVGALLASRNWQLVYGAGDVGLMGTVARAAQEAGGATFGVIPTHLLSMEVGKRDLTSFVVTENMHERKKVMFMNSNAVVVLPGGAGSLDEFFEVLTWRQLGLHDKPLIVLNTQGYWNPLIALIEHTIDQGFADRTLLDFVQVVPDVETLAARLDSALS